jgi:hypothetical protein
VRLEIKSCLPFVGPPGGPPDGRTGLGRQNFWIDEPTDDSRADYQRGQRYGRMTIEAIQERCDTYEGKFVAPSILRISSKG